MFFQDCYQRCLNLQIADPRFVPEEYIVALRDKQNQGEWLDWTVPTQTTIQRLCTRFQLDDLYNSMKFPMGWTREETPNDFEPLTDY